MHDVRVKRIGKLLPCQAFREHCKILRKVEQNFTRFINRLDIAGQNFEISIPQAADHAEVITQQRIESGQV